MVVECLGNSDYLGIVTDYYCSGLVAGCFGNAENWGMQYCPQRHLASAGRTLESSYVPLTLAS